MRDSHAIKSFFQKRTGRDKAKFRPLTRGDQPAVLAGAQSRPGPNRRQARLTTAQGIAAAHSDHGAADTCIVSAVPVGRAGNQSRRRRSEMARRRFVAAERRGSNPARAKTLANVFGATISDDEAHAELPCCGASLPRCNANASLRMRLCIARASHFYRTKFILKLCIDRRSIILQMPAMTPDLF